MMEVITREVQTNNLKEVVSKLTPGSTGKDRKACQSTYSLHHVFARKVKMLKKPTFELGKLMELHGEGGSSGKAAGDETGTKFEQAEGYEPPSPRICLKFRLLMVILSCPIFWCLPGGMPLWRGPAVMETWWTSLHRGTVPSFVIIWEW